MIDFAGNTEGNTISALPSSYLPAGWNYESPNQNSYDGTPAIQKMDPMFVNYPLPAIFPGLHPWEITAIGSYDFHLQPSSPLIGKGYTAIQALTVVPVDPVYGATEVTPAGADLGCYQSNGKGPALVRFPHTAYFFPHSCPENAC